MPGSTQKTEDVLQWVNELGDADYIRLRVAVHERGARENLVKRGLAVPHWSRSYHFLVAELQEFVKQEVTTGEEHLVSTLAAIDLAILRLNSSIMFIDGGEVELAAYNIGTAMDELYRALRPLPSQPTITDRPPKAAHGPGDESRGCLGD